MSKFQICAIFALVAAVGVTPLLAAGDAVTVRAIPNPRGVAPHAASAVVPLGVTAITASYPDPVLPCFLCVPGSAGFDEGLGIPINLLTQGNSVAYTLQFSDNTYTGPCTAYYLVKSSTATVAGGSLAFTGGCQAGYLYYVNFGGVVPAKPGNYQLIGLVVYGTAKAAAATIVSIQ